MIKFSAFADEVSSDFEQQISFLHNEEIKFIEIRFVNKKNIMNLSNEELKIVKRQLDENGIGVSAIGSPIGKSDIDLPEETLIDQFKHALDLAELFQSPFIRIFSYYPPEGKNIVDYRNKIIALMQRKIEILKSSAVILAHENESHIYGSTAERCLDLAATLNSPKFRLAYDPANFVWGQKINDNFKSCWPLLKPFTSHFHVKDWKLGSESVGALPGEGDGQIPELLNDLSKSGYNGFLTIEPHLKVAGKYGGDTGPELFSQAIAATRKICDDAGLTY